MNGTMLIFCPDDALPVVITWHRTPALTEVLHAEVGNWLEKVPGFTWIEHLGKWHPCVALRNQEGKLWNLDANNAATLLWERALRRNGHVRHSDQLVGKIVVLFGDDEFMQSLAYQPLSSLERKLQDRLEEI